MRTTPRQDHFLQIVLQINPAVHFQHLPEDPTKTRGVLALVVMPAQTTEAGCPTRVTSRALKLASLIVRAIIRSLSRLDYCSAVKCFVREEHAREALEKGTKT